MGHDGVRRPRENIVRQRPPRFSLADPVSADGTAIIEGPELHHMRDVMRLAAGAKVALVGANGAEYLATIESLDRGRATLRIAKAASIAGSETGPPFPLILAAAVIKGPRMDLIVEKAAELGATELWPLLCARGVARAPGAERIARWRRVAIAAAKQSLAPTPLRIRDPMPFADLIRAATSDTLATDALKVICTIGAAPLAAVIRRERPASIVLVCGPEGDFTPAEAAMAQEGGFVAAGLGQNRLRSETAAIAAVSIAAATLDETREGD